MYYQQYQLKIPFQIADPQKNVQDFEVRLEIIPKVESQFSVEQITRKIESFFIWVRQQKSERDCSLKNFCRDLQQKILLLLQQFDWILLEIELVQIPDDSYLIRPAVELEGKIRSAAQKITYVSELNSQPKSIQTVNSAFELKKKDKKLLENQVETILGQLESYFEENCR